MKSITIRKFYLTLCIIALISFKSIFADDDDNNHAIVFNGQSSQLYVYDGQPANSGANQHGFEYFDSSTTNNKITVQAWIYLIGDTPPQCCSSYSFSVC